MTETLSDRERARGVMLGLAAGDALGRPVEFDSPEQIERKYGVLDEMVGQGTWSQPAGTVTDDTEMALAIARSLVEREQFDPVDIADRFVEWYETDPFDIGGMTQMALYNLQSGASWEDAGRRVWENSPEGSNAGNGSVMRCAPLAIAYADYPAALIRTSIDSSRITHADPRCTYGCAVLNLTIAAIFDGVEQPLAAALRVLAEDLPTVMHQNIGVIPDGASTVLEGGLPTELRDHLEAVPGDVDESELQTSPYVVTTLQTALYDALTAESLPEAIVNAVNRGGDTDTIGAIAGAVAGARFGADSLPTNWVETLDYSDPLGDLADVLVDYPLAPAD